MSSTLDQNCPNPYGINLDGNVFYMGFMLAFISLVLGGGLRYIVNEAYPKREHPIVKWVLILILIMGFFLISSIINYCTIFGYKIGVGGVVYASLYGSLLLGYSVISLAYWLKN